MESTKNKNDKSDNDLDEHTRELVENLADVAVCGSSVRIGSEQSSDEDKNSEE